MHFFDVFFGEPLRASYFCRLCCQTWQWNLVVRIRFRGELSCVCVFLCEREKGRTIERERTHARVCMKYMRGWAEPWRWQQPFGRALDVYNPRGCELPLFGARRTYIRRRRHRWHLPRHRRHLVSTPQSNKRRQDTRTHMHHHYRSQARSHARERRAKKNGKKDTKRNYIGVYVCRRTSRL